MFRKRRVEQDLDDEVRSYLDLLAQEKIAAGMSPEQARRAAWIELGGVEPVKEACRDARPRRWLGELRQDLRYAARVLGKSPGFTAVAVLTLALGIGADTAIFSVAHAVLLQTLPARDAQELVQLSSSTKRYGERDVFTHPIFEMLRDGSVDLFDGIFAFKEIGPLNAVYRGNGEIAFGMVASGSMYTVLGVRPALGRLLNPEDGRKEGCCPVAVLSYGYFERRFARDALIIGQVITLNGNPYTIVGVTPRDFRGLRVGWTPDITVPITMIDAVWGSRQMLQNRGNTWVCAIARKKPNVTNEQVRAALEPTYLAASEDAFASQPSRYFAAAKKDFADLRFEVRPAARGGLSLVRDKLADPLLLLAGAAGVLLLIACTNIATLLLARADGRRREIGVRLALGAGRGRLVRQLLTESLVLSALGGAAGLALAAWAGPALAVWLSDPAGFERVELWPDWRMLAFAASGSLLTGALFGLAPAWRASRQDLTLAMRASAAADGRQLRRWAAGPVLVAGQLALALPLLAAAALFVRSLENLQHVDPGHVVRGGLLFSVDPSLAGYRGPRLQSFYRDLLSRIEATPGVVSATFSQAAMGRLQNRYAVEVPGREAPSAVGRNIVGPGFAATMGMTIVQGRDFGSQDSETSPPVAVVNESFTRHYFGAENPIGRKISILLAQREDIREIVGVVKDARDRGVREPPGEVVYVPYSQVTAGQMTFAVRTAVAPASLIGQMRQQARELDPTVPVTGVKTMQAQMEESLGRERLVASLSSGFGGLAVLLACVGLYGVLSYTMAQKTKEIGVRMALGARPGDIVRLVLRQLMTVLGVGLPAGLAAALATGRFVSPMLYGLKPADPATLAAVVVVLSLIAVVAGYLPARRATRVDLMEALRHE